MEPKASNESGKQLEPTRAQRFYASRWPELLWSVGFAAITSTIVLIAAGASFEAATGSFHSFSWFVIVGVLGTFLGLFLAAFPRVLWLGPTLYGRGLINGAPFRVGDLVQIIGGKFDSRVCRVYSKWQHDSVRVQLGEEAADNYEDIFGPTQLLRIATFEDSQAD